MSLLRHHVVLMFLYAVATALFFASRTSGQFSEPLPMASFPVAKLAISELQDHRDDRDAVLGDEVRRDVRGGVGHDRYGHATPPMP